MAESILQDHILNNEKKARKTELVLDDGRIESIEEYTSPEELYEDLIVRVRKYHPSDDISLIEKAYRLADDAHRNQVRKSGEPYIIHPLCVAIILADLEMDKETIAAGLLHDVVEDTIFTTEEIREQFGDDVALLVDGVTKLSRLQYDGDKLELQAENLRKMFLAMAKDIRVILIKLADRLHNMRTLDHMTPEKQQEKARETLDIYSPIAQRLGISKVKVELDDLSLKYLEPEVYYDLVDKIAIRRSEREKYVQNIVDELKGEKIDIIKWSKDPAEFLASALSPAKVLNVTVDEETKSAKVIVDDNQLSLAIGKEGQNVRLAAKLTNWKIDIKSKSQAEALEN